jgi:site-specific recombinase XerD
MPQLGDADRAVLVAYRAYMARRHFARTTIAARMSASRRWVHDVPDWQATTFRTVEAWTGALPISVRTQRNVLVSLRAFYKWALREGLTDHDPTALVDAPRLPTLLPRPALEADIAMLLGESNAELTAMVALMSCLGLRCVEVANLRWCDVDLHDRWIFVLGKGRKERRLRMPASVVRLVAALEGTDGPVFPGRYGDHRSPSRVSQMVSRAFRDAGIKRTTAHQLRHRAATRGLELTGDLLAVRDMLGHESVATTQGYAQLVAGKAAALSESIELPDSREE